MGYEIHKAGLRGDYSLCPPYDYCTYSPWFEKWFQKIYFKIKDYTVVTEDRCYIIQKFCQHCSQLEGDFAECGVYKGGTAFLISNTLKDNSIQDKQLHLFDTFAGMPDIANNDASSHKKGDFGDVSLDSVKNYIHMFPFVVFHSGLIPNTFEEVKDRRFAFVHIDVDLYQTKKDCCKFFYDRMIAGGVMIFDEYGLPGYKYAEKQAVDDFINNKPESPISLRTGQCVIIKL